MEENETRLQEDQVRNLEFEMTSELEMISNKLIEKILEYVLHSDQLTMVRDSNQYIDMNLRILSALWTKLQDNTPLPKEEVDNLLTGCDLPNRLQVQIEGFLTLE